MKLTRKIAAAHEAGHAVVSAVQGVEINFVFLEKNDEAGTGGGCVTTYSGPYHPYFGPQDEVVRKMAGGAGERIGAGKPPENLTFARVLSTMRGDYLAALGDIEAMADLIEGGMTYPPHLDRFVREEHDCPDGIFLTDTFCTFCYETAYDILDKRREFHSRVMAALMKRGRLSGDEVMELL